jgi:hypothetical protein
MAKMRGVKLGDIALLLDPAKQGATPLIRITQVETGLDGHIRRVICFDRFNTSREQYQALQSSFLPKRKIRSRILTRLD